MNVLIIGGTGILSGAVVNECVNQDIDVTMLNRGHRKLFINPKVTLMKCDVRDENQLKQLIKGKHYDCVIDFLIYNLNQLDYSLRMFSSVADQYVFISSTAVYNTDNDELLTENSEKVQKKWKYSINKNACEMRLIDYCTKNSLNYTIIRPGVNYGNTRIPYGMYPNIGQHWTIVGRILSGKPIITWNNGQNRHNLTRVEDFAAGAVGLIGNTKAYNEAFNVVGDYSFTWKEVLDTLGKLLCKDVKTIDIPVKFYADELHDGEQIDHLLGGRSFNCMSSNQKLKSIVPNFESHYSLEDGLKLTLEFYKKNNYLGGIDYSYEGMMDRIINKYLASIGEKQLKLPYSNYLPTESFKQNIKNRINYYFARYEDCAVAKTLKKIKTHI